ncbi:hypothetical protein [Sphaerisporangium sp. TRM90804]|uniref:hypothetical protein n=1 Tax=Sphaerisporangium sp. TRM90804 TaxID=3031113 RepID=UPI0024494BBA|nr:hypothetical protein [Sphaerisporangium sp. TRM90804]MDH2424728.1 hypothetical protein [Sphaerisporangium sp. TRM90804]
MAKSGYSITTEGEITLTTSAKSILGVKSGATTANHGVDLLKYRVSFLGVSASAVPVLVEVCLCTFGANPPGTNSTSATIYQNYGRHASTGFSAAKNWTTEPTTISVIEAITLTPNGGTLYYDGPLGTTPDSPLGEGFVIRCTAPAGVGVRASMLFERC